MLFLGRQKETLKVGGETPRRREIEAQLATHPAVKLVQVVGIPDARLVEVPAAFVELVPGAHVDEQELIDHCRGRIASFKVPRVIRFVADGDWPMSATRSSASSCVTSSSPNCSSRRTGSEQLTG